MEYVQHAILENSTACDVSGWHFNEYCVRKTNMAKKNENDGKKKLEQKEPEGTVKVVPDIEIIIKGKHRIGKTIIADTIGKALKDRKGWAVYMEQEGGFEPGYVKVKNHDFGTSPDWDEKVRKVAIRCEDK